MENKINAMIEIGSGSITTKTVLKITGMIEKRDRQINAFIVLF